MSIMNRTPSARRTAARSARAGLTARALCAVATIGLTAAGCARTDVVTLERTGQPITVHRPALYPETIEFDSSRGKFLVSSFREGAIYAVDGDGGVSVSSTTHASARCSASPWTSSAGASGR